MTLTQDHSKLLWLKNAVLSLGISGIYSIILVILRTPQLSHFFTNKSMFKSALIIHVNLSVLVWLLSITCFIWGCSNIKLNLKNLFSEDKNQSDTVNISKFSLTNILAYTSFCGMIIMAFSPLYPESEPIMNNYIPILENIFFIIGLSLFGSAVLILSIWTLFTSFMQEISDYGTRIIAITKFTSSFMFICVWICFTLSFFGLEKLRQLVPLDIDFYYEMLFWSGGHLLQFIYTQILMLALLILVETWRGGRVAYPSVYEMLFALNFILSLVVFFGHAYYDLSDGSFKEFYTLHMIYTAGVVPTIFITILGLEIIQYRVKDMFQFIPICFLSSILLFLSGGLMGTVIAETNVTIPAHYHGSIVGITIAFIGITYIFCFQKEISTKINKLGGVIDILFTHVKRPKQPTEEKKSFGIKAASWQIIIITVGQILHITGLFLAGGYGVLRKDPNIEMALSAKLYMGMVGIGGLLAIIGGLIFVYICAKNLFSCKREI